MLEIHIYEMASTVDDDLLYYTTNCIRKCSLRQIKKHNRTPRFIFRVTRAKKTLRFTVHAQIAGSTPVKGVPRCTRGKGNFPEIALYAEHRKLKG